MITVEFKNFWPGFCRRDNWFIRHLRRNFPNVGFDVTSDEASNPDLLFISVFGDPKSANVKARAKIFFTGENLNRFPMYSNFRMLDSVFDLIMGFHFPKSHKHIRFPLWLLYVDWYERMDYYLKRTQCSDPSILSCKTAFCTLISRSDSDNRRRMIFETILPLGQVNCPGTLFNNCPRIHLSRDAKLNFLRGHLFNICPENSHSEGYVTEKLFDCFEEYCLPIYWGNRPVEPTVVNQDRIPHFDFLNPRASFEMVSGLLNQPALLEDYFAQPIFLSSVGEVIGTFYKNLNKAFTFLLDRAVS